MGYESRIYVVSKRNILLEHGKQYASEIARLNMSLCGDFTNVFTKETDCYIYADDDDTMIFKDEYGKPLTEARVDDVVTWLERKIESGEDYRRFKVALSLLKSFQAEQFDGENLAVLHYGY